MDETTTRDLVKRATGGEEAALTEVVKLIQDLVFNLAVRMLGRPEPAEDATQEVLIRVVTHLSTFRGESAFTTWVYRIALNYLLNDREKTELERERTFAVFGSLVDMGVASFSPEPMAPVDHVLRNEVRLNCTHGMVVCLSRQERAAFILGAILELSGDEASDLLGVTPALFRKRLSRARGRLEEFMRPRCGLFNRDSPCRCDKQVPFIQGAGKLDPDNPAFAKLMVNDPDASTAGDEHREFVGLMNAVQVIDSQPDYAAPDALMAKLRSVLGTETMQ